VKIKLDENLPEALARELAALGHDVDNARQEGLAGKPDSEVWQAAQSSGRFLITQDLDFSDIRKKGPGSPYPPC
jgi:predicted nuclease of predicted toxin-antitoxin system